MGSLEDSVSRRVRDAAERSDIALRLNVGNRESDITFPELADLYARQIGTLNDIVTELARAIDKLASSEDSN